MDLPMKNNDFPQLCQSLPEGISSYIDISYIAIVQVYTYQPYMKHYMDTTNKRHCFLDSTQYIVIQLHTYQSSTNMKIIIKHPGCYVKSCSICIMVISSPESWVSRPTIVEGPRSPAKHPFLGGHRQIQGPRCGHQWIRFKLENT